MIKKTIKDIADLGSPFIGLNTLIKQTNYKLILPFYHLVSDDNPIHIKNLYTVRGIKQFKADLDYLLANYKSISLHELIEINKAGKIITENCFHLTFDDGLKEFYTIIAPILNAHKVYATVFLNSDFIDNKALFYRFKASVLYEKIKPNELLNMPYSEKNVLDDLAIEKGINFDAYLKNKQPYLTTEQIEELIVDGFTFGAHSKDHPLYKTLSLNQQINQTKESLTAIKTQFKLPYSVFSFPFTDEGVSQQLFTAIEGSVDLTFGCAGLKEDTAKNHLQRIPMETSQSAKGIIKSAYLYCLIKQKIGKNKIVRE